MRKLSLRPVLIILLAAFVLVVLNWDYDIPEPLEEELTPGDQWNTLTKDEHLLYLIGFQTGHNEGMVVKLLDIPVPPPTQETRTHIEALKRMLGKSLDNFDLGEVEEFMTDLYSDSANTYITFRKMLRLARLKLGGASIEEDLMDYRWASQQQKDP